MRADASFAVPVKLWALLCVFAGVTIGGNVLLTCILTGKGKPSSPQDDSPAEK